MKLFDLEIQKTIESLAGFQRKELAKVKPWPITEKPSFLMERESVLELGGYPRKSTCLIGATTNLELVNRDQISCYGDLELFNKAAKHISFGIVILLNIQEPKPEMVYEEVKNLQYSFYKMHMENIMLRSSLQQLQVNLRLGKQAFKKDVTLEQIGSTIVSKYRELPNVKHVQVAFLLGEELPYGLINACAEKNTEILLALNNMIDREGLSCGTCGLKEICNEVEGLRQTHMDLRKLRMDGKEEL